jgi:hypothetical protein
MAATGYFVPVTIEEKLRLAARLLPDGRDEGGQAAHRGKVPDAGRARSERAA